MKSFVTWHVKMKFLSEHQLEIRLAIVAKCVLYFRFYIRFICYRHSPLMFYYSKICPISNNDLKIPLNVIRFFKEV